MNRSPILFRCDGSAEQGYEAFYQCLVLANAMQRRRRGTHFFSHLDPLSLALVAHRGGHEWREATDPVDTGDDLETTLREVRRLQAAAVVVAAPAVGEDYYRDLCATGVLVVAIDSTAEITFPNRLVVNPLLGVGKERFRYERGTQLLVGTRYALVRPMVRRLRPIRAQEPPQPFRALVMLGDDDRQGRSLPLAQQLLDTPKVERVDVAVRTHHAQIDELRALAEANTGRLEIATEPSEVSARLSRCHFAVTSGDGVALELACLGVPQLMMTQSAVHAPNAARLDEESVAMDLGPAADVTPDALQEAVQTLLGDPMERQGMARCGRQLIDGRGPDRLVTALEVLLHPAHPATEGLRIAA